MKGKSEILRKFGKVIEAIGRDRGELLFAGLIQRKRFPYKLEIVVAANWILDEYEFMQYLVTMLQTQFSESEFPQFARMVVLDPHGEFLEDFSRIYGAITKDMDISNVRIAEISVLWGHIYATNSVEAEMAFA